MVLGLIRINIYSYSYSWLHFQLDYYDANWIQSIGSGYLQGYQPSPLFPLHYSNWWTSGSEFPHILQRLTKQISTFGWSCGHKNEHNLTISEVLYLKYSVSLNNILWNVSCSWRLMKIHPQNTSLKKIFLALWKWVQVNWEKRVLRHWIRTIILVPSQNSRLSW